MMLPLMDVYCQGTTTVVRFNRAVLDWEAAKVVGDELARLVDQTRPQRLRLDLGSVRLLTAAMLGRFLEVEQAVRDRGGELTLCNVGFPLYHLFEVTRLAERLDVQPARLHVGTGEESGEREGPSLACGAGRNWCMSP
jgi:anti-anti-sigma factor